MKLSEPLIKGMLISRYKRFLADVWLENDKIITTHCPNSGSMMGLLQSGNPVLLSKSNNPKRKFPYTWELVQVSGTWAGVNTITPNRLINEALLNKQIPELVSYGEIKSEVFWEDHSRLDFCLRNDKETCFVEVKNVTLAEHGTALFPDAKTERGTKHLNALVDIVRHGNRGIMCFLVNRADCHVFKHADAIDPIYSETLRISHKMGVEILVYQAKIRPPQVSLGCRLEFEL
ncbi:MAG: DNA/RNA nuclease SfsA [bacterium]